MPLCFSFSLSFFSVIFFMTWFSSFLDFFFLLFLYLPSFFSFFLSHQRLLANNSSLLLSFFFSVFLLLLSLSSLCVCIFLLVSLAFFLHLLVYSSLVCLGFRFIFHLCSVVSIAPGCLSPSPSLFGVSVWRFHRGVVFVGVSSFLTGSVASALPVFHSIYVRWSSTLLSSLSIFRPPLCHFVCPFSRFSSSGHSDHCLLQPPLSSLLSVHNRLHFLSSTALSGWSLIDHLFWPPFWPRSVPWTLVAIGYLAIPLRSLLYYMSPSDFIVIFIFVGSVRLFLFSSVSVRRRHCYLRPLRSWPFLSSFPLSGRLFDRH